MAASRSTSLRAASLLLALAGGITALPQLAPATPATFTFDACYMSETNGKRVLAANSFGDDGMTVEKCATFCKNNKYFGLEYGRECWCGDDKSAAQQAPAADCSFPCAGNNKQKCGAGGRQNLYLNTAYVAPSAPVAATLDVPYLGCFSSSSGRVLNQNLLGADDMTAAKCQAHCSDYPYFGIEYGRECWCGNDKPTNPVEEKECSFTCAGDKTQLCGAGGRFNAWGVSRNAPIPATPEPVLEVGEYEHIGCYTDKGDQRSLKGSVTYHSEMTVEMCAAACDEYDYFGVEFGTQCYCGTKLEASAVEAEGECTQACGGNGEQQCGAGNRINVYVRGDSCEETATNLPTVGAFNYKSCWADNVNARVLSGGITFRSNDMTIEKCAEFCGKYSFFGLEFSNECYCANKLTGVAAPEETCSQLCKGNSDQWCGGADSLSIYEKPAATGPFAPIPRK